MLGTVRVGGASGAGAAAARGVPLLWPGAGDFPAPLGRSLHPLEPGALQGLEGKSGGCASHGGPAPELLFWDGGEKPKTEAVLKDLQKHFRGEWLASIQDLAMVC